MAKILKKYLLLGLLPLLLAGCATSTPVKINVITPGLGASSSIAIVHQKPTSGQLVAHLSVQGAPGQTLTQLTSLLMQKAASLGATELYIVHQESKGEKLANPVEFNPAGGNYQASEPLISWTIDADAYAPSHS